MWPLAQFARGPRGHCPLPTLSAFPSPVHTVHAPAGSGRRLPGQSRAAVPTEARRAQERPWEPRGAGGEGVAAPPPGGARALPTAARQLPQPVPAAPCQPGRRPSPRPKPPRRTPEGWPGHPGQRSSGEPPARACGLVGVT